MLLECYKYLTTPCRPLYRKLGYLKGIIALESRYHRVAERWNPHSRQTRQAIIDAAVQCAGKEKAVVMGSGILSDVPLAELSSLFDEVVLLDIVHLPSVRRQVCKFQNVWLVEHDVTGLAEQLKEFHPGMALPEPVTRLPEGCDDADLLVSINMLSQLAMIPRQYLEKLGVDDEPQLDNWCYSIVNSHLEMLRAYPGQCCLVTDTTHHYVDAAEQLIMKQDMLYGASLPEADRQWWWEIAPIGELDKAYRLKAEVSAFLNYR